MLLDHSPEATYAGITFVYNRLEKHRHDAEALAQYVIPLMKRSCGEWINQGMFSWEWEQLAHLYLISHPVEIADAAFTVFRLSDISFYLHDEESIREVVNAAFQQAPEAVWNRIIERMHLPEEHPEHISAYYVRNLQISSQETIDVLLKWAGNSEPEGPEIVAEMAFTGGKSLNNLVRQLIVKYSDNENVKSILTDNYIDVGIHDPSEYVELLR